MLYWNLISVYFHLSKPCFNFCRQHPATIRNVCEQRAIYYSDVSLVSRYVQDHKSCQRSFSEAYLYLHAHGITYTMAIFEIWRSYSYTMWSWLIATLYKVSPNYYSSFYSGSFQSIREKKRERERSEFSLDEKIMYIIHISKAILFPKIILIFFNSQNIYYYYHLC